MAALNRTANVPCYRTKTRLTLGPSRWDSVRTTYATQGCAKARKARLASALGFDRVVPSGRQSIARLCCSDYRPIAARVRRCWRPSGSQLRVVDGRLLARSDAVADNKWRISACRQGSLDGRIRHEPLRITNRLRERGESIRFNSAPARACRAKSSAPFAQWSPVPSWVSCAVETG